MPKKITYHDIVRVTCNEAVNVITTVPGSASQMRGSINF